MKKHHSTLLSPAPPLHKLHSIQRMGFGTNNKIFLEFQQPFWEPQTEAIYLLWEDEAHLVDTVPNIHTHWVRKLFGFTVLKPTERYAHAHTHTRCVQCTHTLGQEAVRPYHPQTYREAHTVCVYPRRNIQVCVCYLQVWPCSLCVPQV